MTTFLLWTAGVGCIGFGMLMDWRGDAEPVATLLESLHVAAQWLRSKRMKR